MSLRPDHLKQKRLAQRIIERGDQALRHRQHIHVPELDHASKDEDGENRRLNHQQRLRDHQRAAFRQPIGQHTAVEREDHHRQELQRDHCPQRQRRIVGQLQDQPGLRRGLHPCAGDGDDLTEPKQAKVAHAQRLEAARGGDPPRMQPAV